MGSSHVDICVHCMQQGSRHCKMSVAGQSPDSHGSHLSVTVWMGKKRWKDRLIRQRPAVWKEDRGVLLVVSTLRLSFLKFPMSIHGETSGGAAKHVTGGCRQAWQSIALVLQDNGYCKNLNYVTKQFCRQMYTILLILKAHPNMQNSFFTSNQTDS